jgi:hypothetical protein
MNGALHHALQFGAIHETLKTAPSMAAGATSKLREILIWWPRSKRVNSFIGGNHAPRCADNGTLL